MTEQLATKYRILTAEDLAALPVNVRFDICTDPVDGSRWAIPCEGLAAINLQDALLDYGALGLNEFLARYPSARAAMSPAPDAVEERDLLAWFVAVAEANRRT